LSIDLLCGWYICYDYVDEYWFWAINIDLLFNNDKYGIYPWWLYSNDYMIIYISYIVYPNGNLIKYVYI